MKKFMYISLFLFSLGCTNNKSKLMEAQTSEIHEQEEEQFNLSENDAYALLVRQKLQEYIDTKVLASTNPDFTIKTNHTELLSLESGATLKNINFISPFETISDSIKKVTTRVVMGHKVDTILTYIKTSKIEIEGEQLLTTKVTFDTIKK